MCCGIGLSKGLGARAKLHRSWAGLTQLYVISGNQEKTEQELIRAINADRENEALLHLTGNLAIPVPDAWMIMKALSPIKKKRPNSLVARKRLS
jgi:hypothetical protein